MNISPLASQVALFPKMVVVIVKIGGRLCFSKPKSSMYAKSIMLLAEAEPIIITLPGFNPSIGKAMVIG